MDILNKNPLSKKEFFHWFSTKYEYNEEFFDTAPELEKLIEVSRFLGYPIEFDERETLVSISKKVENYLYIYECLKLNNPEGIIDPIKELKEMEYKKREKVYSEINRPSKVLWSLCMMLVSRSEINKPLWSLKDILVKITNPIVPKISETEFWENVFKESIKDETAPF